MAMGGDCIEVGRKRKKFRWRRFGWGWGRVLLGPGPKRTFAAVFLLKELRVVCFDTLLQVLILKNLEECGQTSGVVIDIIIITIHNGTDARPEQASPKLKRRRGRVDCENGVTYLTERKGTG
jgi:hypothetical protein